MRVIAGSARRLQLKTPEGKNTRPTSDRIKETLFNIVQNDIYGCRILDLFAGSGALGIEALSRGANDATFVDNNREAIKCIEYNVKHTHFDDKSTVLHMDSFTALKRLQAWNKRYDIIFVDPPYEENLYKTSLKAIKENKILAENGIIILEMSIDEDVEILRNCGYEIYRIKEYKTNKHIFLRNEM